MAQFSIQDIAARVQESQRRARLCDFGQVLAPPNENRPAWGIRLPFTETLAPALRSCGIVHSDFRCVQGEWRALLPGLTESDLARLQLWLGQVSGRVAMRDLFSMSFALDYRTPGGDYLKPPTKIGEWVGRAKAYEGYKHGPEEWATHCLAQEMLAFIRGSGCFDACDAVVAVPGSNPKVKNSLPSSLAAKVASKWDRTDLSGVLHSRKRSPLKDAPVSEKLQILSDAIEVDAAAVRGRTILLVDDLYQSGTTMNYLALRLLEAGAADVMALTCVKTVRDDDNTSWRAAR
jgi:hypothetical protein